jgi:hypothetical protein
MKRLLFIITVGLLLPERLIAQCSQNWVQQISPLPNGTIGNAIPSMAVDGNGNVIVSNLVYNAESLSAGGMIFDQFAATFVNTDIFIAKYSNSGDFQWLKTLNGVGLSASQDIATDENGNIYVSGYFSTSIMVEDSLFTHSGVNGLGYFIMKLNADGEFQWLRKNVHRSSVAYCIEWTGTGLAFAIPFIDSLEVDGQLFYAGTQLYPEAQDLLFGVLDADGGLIQSSLIGGEGTLDIRAMACNSAGCLLQGRFEKELTSGNLILSTPALDHYSLYQLHLRLDGNPFWAHSSTNLASFHPTPNGLGFADDSTAVFALQYLYSSFNLGGHSISEPASDPNKTDIAVGKLHLSNGSLEWLKKMNGNETDVLTDLDVFNSNAVLVGGSDSPQLFFEGYEQANSGGVEDGFAVSIDGDGKSRCGLGFHGNGQERVRQVHFNADGSLFALVSVTQSLEIEGVNYIAQGSVDLLVMKTCLPCDTLTSIAETPTTNPTLQIYPNPANQSVRVELAGSHAQAMGISITDMLGHAVLSLPYAEVGGADVNISNLANGIYTIAATMQSGETLRQRLVVQH